MSRIIAVQSFRRGTGKSSFAANIATLLAVSGRRVGVVDTGIQAPSQHILFGLDDDEMGYTLNDYLQNRCEIEQTAYDMTARLSRNVSRSAGEPDDTRARVSGHIYLIPASTQLGATLREGYDIELLNQGLRGLIKALALDTLVIDTHAGLHKETLLSMAVADSLVITLRLDRQDYQGTAVMVDVARKLDVPHIALTVNEVAPGFDLEAVRAQVEQSYSCPVVAVLPHATEMVALASAGIFVLHYPAHPLTEVLKQALRRLMTPLKTRPSPPDWRGNPT